MWLYLTAVLIWGTTWIFITWQLGSIDPLVSVVYRFALAAAFLLLFCWYKGYSLKFSLKQHLMIALQGAFLFGLNYWLIYVAQESITSGLVAIIFSSIVIMNVFNGRLILGNKISLAALTGALLGLLGIGCVFLPEVQNQSWSDAQFIALGIAFLATYVASIGNIVSVKNQSSGLKVFPTCAMGMTYGAIFLAILAFSLNLEFAIDWSFRYLGSLLYLSVVGSVLAFAAYLTLMGRIGAVKASYSTLFVPIVALVLSTVFESYQWHIYSVLGLSVIILGQWLVLRSKA